MYIHLKNKYRTINIYKFSICVYSLNSLNEQDLICLLFEFIIV